MIDYQQVKHKIIILFRLADRLPFLFPVLCGLGGLVQKRQPGRADFGEVVRPAYPPPIIPHLILQQVKVVPMQASATLHLPESGSIPDPDQPFPWIHVDKIPKLVHVLEPVLYYLKYIDLRFLILIFGLYLNSSAHIDYPVTLHVI